MTSNRKSEIRAAGQNARQARDFSPFLQIDRIRCTDCGSCSSVCMSGALTIGEPDWNLEFNPEQCSGCKLCSIACPAKAIRIREIA